MKRITWGVVSVLAAFCFVGCGGSDSSTASDSTTASDSSTAFTGGRELFDPATYCDHQGDPPPTRRNVANVQGPVECETLRTLLHYGPYLSGLKTPEVPVTANGEAIVPLGWKCVGSSEDRSMLEGSANVRCNFNGDTAVVYLSISTNGIHRDATTQ